METGTRAALDVIAERHRHITGEGFTCAHDDAHRTGEMALAAVAYIMTANAAIRLVSEGHDRETIETRMAAPANTPPRFWPWSKASWKPAGIRCALVKAGALIIAEIERIDRADAKEADHG